MRILDVNCLAVNSLAVNGALPLYVESKSVLHTQYSVKKCLGTLYEASYPLSVLSEVGEVVEGLDVFRKLESMGSSSGEPRHMVEVYDCGEVARRRLPPARTFGEP